MTNLNLYPDKLLIRRLLPIFSKLRNKAFPCLRQQFDQDFELRYKDFWDEQKATGFQTQLFNYSKESVRPFPGRLEFDMEVCEALGIKIAEKEIIELYEVIVREMMITRRLTRD